MIFGVPFITFVFYYLILIIMVEVALLTIGNTIVVLMVKVIRAAIRESVKAVIVYQSHKDKMNNAQEGVNDASSEEGPRGVDSVDTGEVRQE